MPLLESTPRVSVVISAYGNANYLNQAIDSVVKQTYRDYELIIVDDCSDPEIAAAYRIPDDAVFIEHEQRQGCGAAGRNTGIWAAKGEYVAFLDVDDVWMPYKLQAQVDLLDQHPEAALAYCHHVLGDEDLHPLAKQDSPRAVSRDPLRQMIRGCFIQAPSCVMIRRDVLIDLGGFSTNLIANDWDMWIRIAAEHSLINDPNPGVIYRVHPRQMSANRVGRHRGTIAVLEKALSWAAAERPEMAGLIRQRLCRILQKQSLLQMRHGLYSDARQSLRRASSVWPWSLRTYALLARVSFNSHIRLNGAIMKGGAE